MSENRRCNSKPICTRILLQPSRPPDVRWPMPWIRTRPAVVWWRWCMGEVKEGVQITCMWEKRDIIFPEVDNPRRAGTARARVRSKCLHLSRTERPKKGGAAAWPSCRLWIKKRSILRAAKNRKVLKGIVQTEIKTLLLIL